MIAPGMHLNAVGGDCPGKTELHPDILRRPDVRVVVEFEPQSRIEGEIQQMEADFPVTELSRVLAGSAPGRAAAHEVTIFDSVGFALEDFSSLRYLHARAPGGARHAAPDRPGAGPGRPEGPVCAAGGRNAARRAPRPAPG